MAKRLEEQLTEAQASVAEAARAHAVAQAEHNEAIAAALKVYDAAKQQHQLKLEARRQVIRDVEVEKHLRVKPSESQVWAWHPELLDRVAKVVGFSFAERARIDPRNQGMSLYSTALEAIVRGIVDKDERVIAARRACAISDDMENAARRAWYTAKKPVEEAKRVLDTEASWAGELAIRIAERDEKAAEAKAPTPNQLAHERKAVAEFEEKAREARAVLKAITKGEWKGKL